MGVYNVAINYPDGEQARIIAAFKKHFGQIEDPPGTFRDRTNAEALAAFASGCRKAAIDIVQRVEDNDVVVVAKATVTPANIT